MTIIRKDFRNNWSAKDQYNLTDLLVLEVRTTKISNGSLVTVAQVSRVDGEYLSFMPFSDFIAILITSYPTKSTERIVAAQHAGRLAHLEEIKVLALAHYSKESVL